jgi:hypothetical protein
MNAVRISKYNRTHPSGSVIEGLMDIPVPGRDEVLIHMRMAPITPQDIMAMQGQHPHFRPKKLPHTLGLEGVGTIQQFGPGSKHTIADGLEIGSWVVPLRVDPRNAGTWADYYIADVDEVVEVPAGVQTSEAAQALSTFIRRHKRQGTMLDNLTDIGEEGYWMSPTYRKMSNNEKRKLWGEAFDHVKHSHVPTGTKYPIASAKTAIEMAGDGHDIRKTMIWMDAACLDIHDLPEEL